MPQWTRDEDEGDDDCTHLLGAKGHFEEKSEKVNMTEKQKAADYYSTFLFKGETLKDSGLQKAFIAGADWMLEHLRGKGDVFEPSKIEAYRHKAMRTPEGYNEEGLARFIHSEAQLEIKALKLRIAELERKHDRS